MRRGPSPGLDLSLASATLLFGALVAGCYDSAHPCVEGLEHGASYRIALGERLPDVPLHMGAVSCRDVKVFDELATGSTIEITLPNGRWGGNQYCEVPLAGLSTAVGLMLTPIGTYGASANGGQPSENMFIVNEMGVSDGCPIQWSIGAVSRNAVAAFPADLPGQKLFVVRSVHWYDMPGCPPANPDLTFSCFDTWNIGLERANP